MKFKLLPKNPGSFKSSDFVKYNATLIRIGNNQKMTPREVDMALYTYDKKCRKGKLYKN